jgi:hypothetical protein
MDATICNVPTGLHGGLWRAGGIRVSCVRHIGLTIPRFGQVVVARPSMSKAKHSR